MQAVIMAAGRGVRMGVLTETTPKPMLLLRGEPKLAYSLETLSGAITEIILIIGYRGNHIREYFGDIFAGKAIRYVEQEELNETGGAVHLAKNLVRGKFLVLNGDDLYYKKDLDQLLPHELAIQVYAVDDPRKFGVVETDETGKLMSIIEKPENPKYNLAATGAYMLNQNLFSYPLVPISDDEYSLPQTLVQMRDKYTVVVEKAKRWFPIGDPTAYAIAQEKIAEFL